VIRIATTMITDSSANTARKASSTSGEFSALFPATVISEVLASEVERRADFSTGWTFVVGGRSGKLPARALAQIDAARSATRAYFERIYDLRSKSPADDLNDGSSTRRSTVSACLESRC